MATTSRRSVGRAWKVSIGVILAVLLHQLTVSECQVRSSGASGDSGASGEPASELPRFTLANGIVVPLVGLGSASGVSQEHVASAIESGYRFVDTAQSHSWGYKEEEVGEAVWDAERRWQDARADGDFVFVQTKIHPQDLGYESTKRAIQLSLQRLRVSSLDSVLLHKPRCWPDVCPREPEGTWRDSWTALEEALDAGLVRAIGICDVDHALLDDLLQRRIPPMIIQNWFDPFHQDAALRARIRRLDPPILYQGYSTLGTQWHHHRGHPVNPVLNHPLLAQIAAEHGATVPQLIINWATLHHGVSVLPASRNPTHQLSNLHSFFFTLTDEQLRAIDGLDGHPPKPTSNQDHPDQVQLNFINQADVPIHVFWVPQDENDESSHVPVGTMEHTSDRLQLTSYHGHTFIFREGKTMTTTTGMDGTENSETDSGSMGRMVNRHVVDKQLGKMQKHLIDDNGDEL